MTDEDKMKRLLEIVSQVQEIYPQLCRVMISDLDDPTTLMITTIAKMEEIAEDEDVELDIYYGDEEPYEEEGDDIDRYFKRIEYNNSDDEGNGGVKH